MSKGILICKLLEDLTPMQAAYTKSVKRRCSNCGRQVWVVPKNLSLKVAIVCRLCMPEVAARDTEPDEPIFIVPAKPFADAIEEDK